MINLDWLKKMKKDDEDWYKENSTKTIREFTNEYRRIKALEIIAEELIMLRAKPVVVNEEYVFKRN
jgi:hypothetical protein